jgi:hypothetical protein
MNDLTRLSFNSAHLPSLTAEDRERQQRRRRVTKKPKGKTRQMKKLHEDYVFRQKEENQQERRLIENEGEKNIT